MPGHLPGSIRSIWLADSIRHPALTPLIHSDTCAVRLMAGGMIFISYSEASVLIALTGGCDLGTSGAGGIRCGRIFLPMVVLPMTILSVVRTLFPLQIHLLPQ